MIASPVVGVSDHVASRLAIHAGTKLITFSGVSGAGKNYAANVLQNMYSGIQMIPSVTTRPKRPGNQDSEYEHATFDEFERLALSNRFLWHVDVHKIRYGTRGADVDAAFEREVPSVMHLIHSRVSMLQKYAVKELRAPGVFSFLVICDDAATLHRRIRSRDASISNDEFDRRVVNFQKSQQECISSGLYHGLIRSYDGKSDKEIQQEFCENLTQAIPEPRAF